MDTGANFTFFFFNIFFALFLHFIARLACVLIFSCFFRFFFVFFFVTFFFLNFFLLQAHKENTDNAHKIKDGSENKSEEISVLIINNGNGFRQTKKQNIFVCVYN